MPIYHVAAPTADTNAVLLSPPPGMQNFRIAGPTTAAITITFVHTPSSTSRFVQLGTFGSTSVWVLENVKDLENIDTIVITKGGSTAVPEVTLWS